MDPWIVGLIALVVVGVGVITFGALFDRARNRRRAAEMLAPPSRTIPNLAPEAPGPRYVSDLQARRPPSRPAHQLTTDERAVVDQELASEQATKIAVGYASKDFLTDTAAGWAVLDAPWILVCGDSIDSIRELLPTLEKLIASRTPLVIVAPSMARDVRATLEVNALRGTLPLLVVLVEDEAVRRTVADRSGATLTERGDRQAGYVLPDHLGRADRWISSNRESFLIAAATDPAT